ncbi:endo-beta-N-acetylglucosaminidase [Streptomyces sp. NPDC048639]|uniref:endo-beta-N-acetylglucosaminidase n=1 Tax=Streptomyces sp. NPDC048639 TaxID=3365581 RepID=UPI003719ED9B
MTGPRQHVSRRRLIAGAATGAAVALLAPAPARALRRTRPEAAESLQPYASYWFPDSFPEGQEPDPGAVWRSLKQWRPEDDEDLPYNVSTVPLAERFTPVPATATARTGQAGVSALVSFAPTAANPSQGAPKADFYALTQWAYLEELVFWGGSSGEGIILAPNAPVVDAAHRNGVPVLGNVFLPPAAFGGDLRWTRELVQQDATGGFPLAARLIEVARTYGFDGWFLNGETDAGGDRELARRFADFVHALRTGAPELRITWYDAFNADGSVGWQGALNDKNARFFQRGGARLADTMFLDFRWRADASRLPSSAAYARRLGRSPYELWAGVDVEANGWATSVDWEAFVPAGRDHVVSYGLYRPEWTLHSLPEKRTPAQFHARDDQFWGGERTDPSAPVGPGNWHPAARHVADRTPVTALPFATTFNTGHGTAWYEGGERTADTEWNHLGLQDPLPGRRWAVATTGPRPRVGFDFDAAWRGGSSVLVEGELASPTTLELFRTRLELGSEARTVGIVHRAEPGTPPVTVEVAVASEEPHSPGAPVTYAYLPAGTAEGGGGWTTSTAVLEGSGGRTVYALGVRLTAPGGSARWRLGALTVGAAPAPAAPAAARITAARLVSADEAELRIAWRTPGEGAPVRHYEVHQLLPGGGRRFLGGTCSPASYVPALRRTGAEAETRLEVRAVGGSYAVSAPASLALQW